MDTPIGYDGYVSIGNKNIGLERIHIEEDTCKSIHGINTLLNFNRAGVPLIEIVTKPCMESAEEAVLYIERLREILLYLEVSDVKIDEGSMRCDVNVSVSNTDKLGQKVEVKNIGSISNVKVAIEYEIKRQIEAINNGEVIKDQTRRFDEATKTTILMREKETGNDYRYFDEPDIPMITLTDDFIENTKKNLPMLPNVLKEKLKELNINDNNTKTLIANKDLSRFLMKITNKCDALTAANLLTGEVMSYLNKKAITLLETCINEEDFVKIINAVTNKDITNSNAKELVIKILEEKIDVLSSIEKIKTSSISEDDIKLIIDKVLSSNEASIVDFKEGKDRAIKFLMGQVMKESKGQANPQIANDLLLEKLKSM